MPQSVRGQNVLGAGATALTYHSGHLPIAIRYGGGLMVCSAIWPLQKSQLPGPHVDVCRQEQKSSLAMYLLWIVMQSKCLSAVKSPAEPQGSTVHVTSKALACGSRDMPLEPCVAVLLT